jgi:chlorite dismutase
MQNESSETKSKNGMETSFLKYTFFKVDRTWRKLDQDTKVRLRKEFLAILTKYSESHGLGYFSLVGLRGDVDFLIVARSDDLDSFQLLIHELLSTELGGYLDIPYSYLALTRRSPYLGRHAHPMREGEKLGRLSKFMFVYPFVKKREWYGLPFVERQKMMAEHFAIGHKYPNISINTGYSFGLDDQEFVLSFEGDDPAEFLSLVEELRSSRASAYTQLETPIFTCRRIEAAKMLELIG